MEFRILGPLEVVERGRVLVLAGGKQRALLGVLLVHANEVVSFDRLIDELWGERPPATATKTVQVFVSQLRKSLGAERRNGAPAGPLVTRGSGYVLEVDPDAVDARRFERELARGRRALEDGDPAAAAEILAAALALWRGPALADFAYEPFAQAEIARLEELRVAALEDRIEADLQMQRHSDVVGELQTLVEREPLREGLWAKLMLALYRCGRQADALGAYQRARARLVDELGLEPGPALQDLQRAILAHEEGLVSPERPPSEAWARRPAVAARSADGSRSLEPSRRPGSLPPALEREASTVFVGRGPELERLDRLLAEMDVRGRTVALITGEPGAGKTRLAAEFARRAGERGARVLYGRCQRESLVPFAPLVEALREHLAGAADEELRRLPQGAAAQLARWLPELGERVPGTPPHEAPDPEAERFRLFEAVGSLLSLAAASTPVVLVLDDLHWADRGTLSLFGHLARDLRPAPLLVVAVYRDVELRGGHPLSGVLADLRGGLIAEQVALGGLQEEELAALIGAWAAQPPAPRLVHSLWQETEGHPFFAQEIVRHLLDVGAIFERDGRMTTEVSVEHIGIPESVKEIVSIRVAQLSDRCQRVLKHAAVLGRDFDVDVLDAIGAVQGEELDALLEEAFDAGLIVEPPTGEGRYAFAHALIRETLYGRLSRTHRSRLHLRVAEARERLGGDDSDVLPQLAYHFLRAGSGRDVVDKAIDYAVAAARDATRRLAYEQAAGHYRAALDALVDVGAEESRQCELLLALGDSEFNAGAFRRARHTFGRASELADRLGLAEELARAAIGFAGPWGYARIVVDERAVELLERALVRLPGGDSALRAEVTAHLAEALTFSTERERAEALGRAAAETARRVGDESVLAGVLAHATFATWGPDNLDERLAAGQEITALAERGFATRHEPVGRMLLTSAHLERAERDDFERELDTYVRLCRERGESLALAFAELTVGAHALWRGALDEAESRARRALAVAPAAANPTVIAAAGALIGAARELQGRMAEQRAGASALGRHFSARPVSGIPLLLVDTALGREAEVRAAFERFAPADFGDLPRDLEWLPVMEALADACVFLRDERRAATLYGLLEPYAHRVVAFSAIAPRGAVARCLGCLAALLRRWEDAERHFTTAIELNARLEGGPALARSRIDFAQMLLARDEAGDRAQALALLDQAAEPSERLGWHALWSKCEALRGEALGTGRQPHPYLPRRSLGERASRATADARIAVTARARAAVARGVRRTSDEDLERRLGSQFVQRAVFAAAARSFQPDMAFGFEGAIVFELTHVPLEAPARPSDWWTITVKERKATATRGPAPDPAVTIHISVPELARTFSGELNPLTALVEGRVEVEGDVFLGPRLEEMFGGGPLLEALMPSDERGSGSRRRKRASALSRTPD